MILHGKDGRIGCKSETSKASIDKTNCDTKVTSLVYSESTLREQLEKNIRSGIRASNVIERSIERIPLYDQLKTEKICTDKKKH